MLVRCRVNTGVPTQEHGLWFSPKTKFHVTVGTDYPVYGVAMFSSRTSSARSRTRCLRSSAW